MLAILPRRFKSCATRFEPLCENYKTLRHVHFPGITPFAQGQSVQQAMVSANLDFKKIEAKITRLQKQYQLQGVSLQEYEQAFLQRVLSMKPFPTLLTFEFSNVYTGGKQMKLDPALAQKIAAYQLLGCEYQQLERGGQVTWHGPGQMTAYLIVDLKKFSNLTVRCFVDLVLLAAVQNMLLKEFDLQSYTNENPGVFMQPADLKIASVGCNIQRAITSYGVGFNVNPDLSFLNSQVMCGLPGVRATSLKEVKPGFLDSIKDVAQAFAKRVAQRLNITTIEHMDGAELLAQQHSEQ